MNEYMNRYLNGEYEKVTDELNALHDHIFEESYIYESKKIVDELVSRFYHNMELLIPRLKNIGYLFGELPEDDNYWKKYPIIKKAAKETRISLLKLELVVGFMPISIHSFYDIFSSVNLLGYHPEWPEINDLDPIFIESMDGDAYDYHVENYENWLDQRKEGNNDKYILDLSPDDLHKANISGGAPYGIELPCKSFDAYFANYQGSGIYFIDYLRLTSKWAGFPNLRLLSKEEQKIIPVAELTKGFIDF